MQKTMNEQKFWDYALLFFSATLAAVFKYFNEKQNGIKLLITQLLFGCSVAFIIVPFITEKLEFTYKGSLFLTWALTYFSNNALMLIFRTAFGAVNGTRGSDENESDENESDEPEKTNENGS